MALNALSAFTNTDGVSFPNTAAVNSSGALATDGTEFVKAMIDNYMFGRQQALLDHVGMTPDGVAESAGASQEIEALQRMGMHPGQLVFAMWNDTPSNLGIRAIMLTGQGILRANYQDLDAAVYCGDANNAAASAFYHADDAAGTIRNTAGVYLILPDARGQTVRGLDMAGAVDPGGASRDLGSLQVDAFQGHFMNTGYASNSITPAGSGTALLLGAGAATTQGPVTDGVNGTPRTSSETRMTNMATDIGIIY